MTRQIIAIGGGGFLEEPDNPTLDLYAQDRPHSSLGDKTPDEAYFGTGPLYRAGLRPVSGKDQTAA